MGCSKRFTTAFLFRFLPSLFCMFASCAAARQEQINLPPPTKVEPPMSAHVISGITINERAFQLKQEVEKFYAKPVIVKQVQYDDPYYGGESTVSDDGTPQIKINIEGKAKEETLVHELFHLKLRFEGYSSNFLPATDGSLDLNNEQVKALSRFFQDTNDVLLHSIFYPEMRSMGLNPNANYNRFVRQALENGDIDPWRAGNRTTFMFFRSVMEVNDDLVLLNLEERLRKNQAEKSVLAGKRLAQLTKDIPLKTPQDLIARFVTLLNELLIDQCSFRFVRWEEKQRGLLRDRSVIILVEPLKK